MVSEQQIVSFLKARIKDHIQNSGKSFRVNSIMGCFNHHKGMREWFKQKYMSEAQYMLFIHKHKRDFVYNKATGDITINTNPCVRPPVFDEYISGDLQQLTERMFIVKLLHGILEYLKQSDEGEMKCRGEVGILRDELLNHFLPLAKTAFRSPTEEELSQEFRKFCNDNKTFLRTSKVFNKETEMQEFKIYLNAFNERREFNENFIDEVFEMVAELGKDLLANVVKTYLRMDSRGGGYKTFDEVCDYLSANFADLSNIAFNAANYETEDIQQLLEDHDVFYVDSAKEKVTLKARIEERPQKKPEVLLVERRGERLREITGLVKSVDEERSEAIIVADVDDISNVKFVADLYSGEHATPDVKPGEIVVFNASFNNEKNVWCAVKINSVERGK